MKETREMIEKFKLKIRQEKEKDIKQRKI